MNSNKNIRYTSNEDLVILTFLYKYGLDTEYLFKDFKYDKIGESSFYYKYYINDDSYMKIHYIRDYIIRVTIHYYSVATKISEISIMFNRKLNDTFVKTKDVVKKQQLKARIQHNLIGDKLASGYWIKQKDKNFRKISIEEFDYLQEKFNKYRDYECMLIEPTDEEKQLTDKYYDYNFYNGKTINLISLNPSQVKKLQEYLIENKTHITDKYQQDIACMLEEIEISKCESCF